MPSRFPSGSARPPSSVSAHSFWIGLGLACAAITLSIVGFSQENNDDRPEFEMAAPAISDLQITEAAQVVALPREEAVRSEIYKNLPMYKAELGWFDGRQVYRIRPTSYADELIVDYHTGKLIAVNEVPARHVVPSPPPMIEKIISSS